MALPWQTVDKVTTAEGQLELRRRGDDFLITIAGRVLMTSSAHRSEEDLARLACAALPPRRAPRVLLGGLGMGFTLRAALAALPADAHVVVAELTEAVAGWCRGPLAGLCGHALDDPRVELRVIDVARLVKGGDWDAIILDLYEGPNAATQTSRDPFYGDAALAAARAALRPGGVLAIWSEDPDADFERRLAGAGFKVTRQRGGHGGRAHIVYLARA